MKLYTPPKKQFLVLPNAVFDMPLDVYAFKIYAYLVCCAGNRGECWPTMHKMSTKLGMAVSTIQDRINYLVQQQLITIKKHTGPGKYKNNIYVLLAQDNPDIYRAHSEPEELPL